jgi:hypothetical protein
LIENALRSTNPGDVYIAGVEDEQVLAEKDRITGVGNEAADEILGIPMGNAAVQQEDGDIPLAVSINKEDWIKGWTSAVEDPTTNNVDKVEAEHVLTDKVAKVV